ncbi:hypothetical protein ABMA27_013597 [Loxostege sticticalis]|uniref:Endonuclease/exonuclease/phosphatase domain-containing protein n=1 Tax=Loxostege sticticalis TaxID=481309 RepID=A0ABR3IFX3_LOXSC
MESTIKMVTFNCKNVMRSADCIRKLCGLADVVALQETWLLPHDLTFLGSISDDFAFTGVSAVDTSAGVLRGRPHGGVALLWRKSCFPVVNVIKCNSVRLTAIKIVLNDRALLIFSVYMPTDASENLVEFTDCLSEINAIIESCNVKSVFILGDFNAHPGESFFAELRNFCVEQSWRCHDVETLPKDTFTFVSEAHGCRRWLDHCVLTSAAVVTVVNITVLYDTYWSDHFPVLLESNIKTLPKIITQPTYVNKVKWGTRDKSQNSKYHELCNCKLKLIDFDTQFQECSKGYCKEHSHRLLLDNMYKNVISILTEAAILSYNKGRFRKRRHITGWNKHVRDAHSKARLCYNTWLLNGKPTSGPIYNDMYESRRDFKSKLKWCQNNEQQIKMDIIAQHHHNKDFSKFWSKTKVLMGLPRCCSASGMFAEARVDGFHAIMRKRSASLLNRWRGSTNSILTALADRWDCPLLAHLSKLHTTLL